MIAIKKPISDLAALIGGMVPLDPNTLIEIAWPDVTQPTGYGSYKCKLSELNASLASGGAGAMWTAEDSTFIIAADQGNGYGFVPISKIRQDLKQEPGFSAGF